MTSLKLSATTRGSWEPGGTIIQRHTRHDRGFPSRLTSSIMTFPFSAIPLAGDVHPHPGPITPLHSTTKTSAATSPTPPTSSINPQHPLSVSDTQLPLIHPPRLRVATSTASPLVASTTSTSTHMTPRESRTPSDNSTRGMSVGATSSGVGSHVTSSAHVTVTVGVSPSEWASPTDSPHTLLADENSVYPSTSTQTENQQTEAEIPSSMNNPPSSQQFGDLSAIAGTWSSVQTGEAISSQQPLSQSLFSTAGSTTRDLEGLDDNMYGAQPQQPYQEGAHVTGVDSSVDQNQDIDMDNDLYEPALESLWSQPDDRTATNTDLPSSSSSFPVDHVSVSSVSSGSQPLPHGLTPRTDQTSDLGLRNERTGSSSVDREDVGMSMGESVYESQKVRER